MPDHTTPAEGIDEAAAARHLGVAIATLQRWSTAGRIRHTVDSQGHIRYRIADLDRVLVRPKST